MPHSRKRCLTDAVAEELVALRLRLAMAAERSECLHCLSERRMALRSLSALERQVRQALNRDRQPCDALHRERAALTEAIAGMGLASEKR